MVFNPQIKVNSYFNPNVILFGIQLNDNRVNFGDHKQLKGIQELFLVYHLSSDGRSSL